MANKTGGGYGASLKDDYRIFMGLASVWQVVEKRSPGKTTIVKLIPATVDKFGIPVCVFIISGAIRR